MGRLGFLLTMSKTSTSGAPHGVSLGLTAPVALVVGGSVSVIELRPQHSTHVNPSRGGNDEENGSTGPKSMKSLTNKV